MKPRAMLFVYSDRCPRREHVREVEAMIRGLLAYPDAEVAWEVKIDPQYGDRPEVVLTGEGKEVETNAWRS